MEESERAITISIVSHRQNALVNSLLGDIERSCSDDALVVLTENAPDTVPLATKGLTYPVEIVRNGRVKGFGANHNAAFRRCRTPYYCVCNPDVRFQSNPFEPLKRALAQQGAGVAGPLVRSVRGDVEDSARKFPTATGLAWKALGKTGMLDYRADEGLREVDWIAGMCMLFRHDTYRAVNGFDERYFLYYEDVDICRRLLDKGYRVMYEPRSEVVHDARRASRRNPLLAWHHLCSIARFLLSHRGL
jgi:N-acetylglucosaminyl-diphospho-decaprenol L-rhamnosyltransferase